MQMLNTKDKVDDFDCYIIGCTQPKSKNLKCPVIGASRFGSIHYLSKMSNVYFGFLYVRLSVQSGQQTS